MVRTRSKGQGEVMPNVKENGKEDKTKKDAGMAHKALAVMFVSLVLDLLAFTMILPLLPAILDYYGRLDNDWLYKYLKSSVNIFREYVGAPDTTRWNSVLFGGLIGSLFSLLQFIVSPLMGAASDVYGRRPLLLISMAGMSLSYTVWAVSHNFTLFVIARIIGGISKSNISISTTVVADVLPQEKRGRGMALIGVAFSIGFLIGPSIGAGFSSYMRRHEGEDEALFVYPALFALTLAVLDFIFLFAFFKETLPSTKRSASLGAGIGRAVHYINPISLFKFSAVRGMTPAEITSIQRIGVAYFLYLFFYSGLEFTLTFLTHNRFQYDSMQQGKMFLFMGLIMILIQGGYIRRLKPGTEKSYALRGIYLLIPSFVIIAFSHTQVPFFIGLVLFSVASSTVVPCLTTIIAGYGSSEQKGAVMGIFRSLGALARALGPCLASTVYWTSGAHVCYFSGAIMLLIPMYILKSVKEKKV